MKSMETLLSDAVVYFSYSQVSVFDSATKDIACDWTADHSNQGFARRDTLVSFGTLFEFGHARLNVFLGAYQRGEAYTRVIAVPFHVQSGQVRIEGPDEGPDSRVVRLAPGHYRLTACQMVVQAGGGETDFAQGIDLFFERLDGPGLTSNIVVADEELNPPDSLIEYVDTLDL